VAIVSYVRTAADLITPTHRVTLEARLTRPGFSIPAEVDENLVRRGSEIEHGQLLARQKALYEEAHPDTKAKVAGGKAAGLSHMIEQLEQERVVPAGALELGRQ
jgi:hypothetical protein